MRKLFYPLVLIIGFLCIITSLTLAKIKHDTVVGAVVTVAIILAFISEKIIPYNRNIENGKTKRDIIYSFINLFFLMLVGPLSIIGLSLAYRILLGSHTLFPEKSLGPIYIQAIICFFAVDLGRYWIHRAQHRYNWLWKFHSQHHSVKKVYSGNNFYSHPLDLFVRHGVPGYIIASLGFHPVALGVGLGFLALIGIFSHCDADFRLGVINKFITTNQVHRWHHSSQFGAEGKNYAPSLIFWDRIFDTYHFEELGPKDMGLGSDEKDYPVNDMWAYTWFPFRRGKK